MADLIAALDVATAEKARRLAAAVRPVTPWVKVGLELYNAVGPGIVTQLVADGSRVFLDLKLHDIPNTVHGAVSVLCGSGAELLNVHASGGRAMLAAAQQAVDAAAAGSTKAPPLRLLGVTVLTSIDDDEAGAVWPGAPPVAEQVVRLARLSVAAGLAGVVASPHEVGSLRAALGSQPLLVTPGIRLREGQTHDQRRTATPAAAVRAGADMLVVGRAIRQAPDPAAAARQIAAAMTAAEVGEG